MCQGEGEEKVFAGGRGDEGDSRKGLTGRRQAYGRPLEKVTSLKYSGRILKASDDDWQAVMGNICKARKI